MRQAVLGLVASLLLACCAELPQGASVLPVETIRIDTAAGPQAFRVEVAADHVSQERGLMFPPRDAARCRHAVRPAPERANRLLDEEYGAAARHGVHPLRRHRVVDRAQRHALFDRPHSIRRAGAGGGWRSMAAAPTSSVSSRATASTPRSSTTRISGSLFRRLPDVAALSYLTRPVRGVAQPGRALALGAKGREFESRRPDHVDE